MRSLRVNRNELLETTYVSMFLQRERKRERKKKIGNVTCGTVPVVSFATVLLSVLVGTCHAVPFNFPRDRIQRESPRSNRGLTMLDDSV